jgi:hypothetical protein
MYRFLLGLLILIHTVPVFSQKQIKGVVADSITRKSLPFATVRPDVQSNVCIAGINGQFSLSLPANTKSIQVSYISYVTRVIATDSLMDNDTLFLVPAVSTLGEVIIKPQTEKIRRIINAAVRNKPLHNPEMYDAYQCNVYYKMKVDVVPPAKNAADSARLRRQRESNPKRNKKDTTAKSDSTHSILHGDKHLIVSETFSKRYYKRPQQLQEIIIASRFSGLKKTYFTNLVTDFLPFHIYSDYISLNGKDYINPISKGWQQRYDFSLADEINNENDTTFIFAFTPKKNTGFNSLRGLVYINSDGYAISHFSSSTGDTASDREIRIEQVFDKVHGRWFPKELNYDVIYRQYIMPGLKMEMNGHSVLDSVSFALNPGFRFDKAHSVKLGDSVDLYSEEDWKKLRVDSITVKERNTYTVMDSIFKKMKLEKIVSSVGKLVVGRFPLGSLDVDVTRLLATNEYEGTRLGIGLYTNDKISKYYSVGGWAGYGFSDKQWKYGFSATIYPKANKDNRLHLFYNDDYQNAGNIHIHNDIDRSGYRKWLLTAPDRIKEYGITTHTQKGYWGIELDGRKQQLESLYENNFESGGKNYSQFDVKEASIGLRYAYGEKRVPIFGYYFPSVTKYPVVYFRSSFGDVQSGTDYSVKYIRLLMAVNYTKHINRWGNEAIRLEGGIIHPLDNAPLSRSFLLAAKGFRRDDRLSYYAWGGFLTMRPNDYYSNSYFSFLYKHDFDKFLWQLKFSKPFISIAHNFMYGNLSQENKAANAGIAAPVNGYHESGILVNQLLQTNFFHTSYLYFNAGVFYHWTPSFDWQRNGVWLIGISGGF